MTIRNDVSVRLVVSSRLASRVCRGGAGHLRTWCLPGAGPSWGTASDDPRACAGTTPAAGEDDETGLLVDPILSSVLLSQRALEY
jgi:hypothetical protein